MESGQRRGDDGEAIPRKIINRFACTFDGEPVVTLDLHPAISANPFFAFAARAERSGTLAMEWTDDDGAVGSQRVDIVVT